MNLAELFRMSVYALAALAAVMLSLAEGDSAYGGITVLAAVAAYFFCDRWKWLRVPALVVNVLALGALGTILAQLFAGAPETRLLAGAHMLVYLQWLLFLQQKRDRHYWQIVLLSLLHVALAAVLSTAGMLGALMIVYLFLATWTLAISVLYREWKLYAGLENLAAAVDRAEEIASVESNEPLPSSRRPRSTPNSQPRALAGGRFFSAVSRDPSGRVVSPRFFLGIGSFSTAALAFAMVIFLLVPRLRTGWGSETSGSVRAITGFSGEVQLGQMSTILESDEQVMQVVFRDIDTDRALDLEQIESSRWLGGEPLFRGVVLSTYSGGRWTPGRRDLATHRPTSERRIRRRGSLLCQEIELESVAESEGTLFVGHPVNAIYIDDSQYDPSIDTTDPIYTDHTRSFFLSEPLRGRRARYRAYSSVRALREGRSNLGDLNRSLHQGQYVQVPLDELPRLRAAVREVTAHLPPGDHLRRAEELVRWFQETGDFTYDLRGLPERSGDDPVEDFISARRGHCEYFAAALALMLRVDPTPDDGVDDRIPSRVVLGYKGGEWNSLGGFYQVQQRHAHAWVEAYIPEAGTGGWVTLDPTPAAGRSEAVAGTAPTMGWLHELTMFFRHVWSGYVTGLDAGRQQTQIFRPLGEFFGNLFRPVAGLVRRGPALLETVGALLSDPERWFSWQGALLVLGIGLVFVVGFRLVRASLRRLRRTPGGRKRRQSRRGLAVACYERLVKVLARAGLTREPVHTPMEFGRQAAMLLGARPWTCEVAGVPGQIVAAYYGVRFGSRSLAKEKVAELDDALDRLEATIVRERRAGRK